MKSTMIETAVNWTDDTAHMSSNDRKVIKRILRLYEAHPDKIHVLQFPEMNGGYLLADIPAQWVRFSPQRKLNLTSAQKLERAQRLKAIRNRN